MHNPDQSKHDQDQLHTEAQRDEILCILKSDGPCYVCDVVRKTGLKATEVRWHLEELRRDGEVGFNWVTMRYSV